MNKLKHVALFIPDPEEIAKFYQDVFGLEVAGPTGGGVYLTASHINLDIPFADVRMVGPAGAVGLDHFGFQVDDREEAERKLEAVGSKELPSYALFDGADYYYEVKYESPNNQTIDIITNGWIGTDQQRLEEPMMEASSPSTGFGRPLRRPSPH